MVNGENARLSALPRRVGAAQSEFCMRKGLICGEEKRGELLKAVESLVGSCPRGHNNPTMCPLHDVRARAHATRRRWLEKLTDDDVRFISEYHRICMEWQKAGCP